MKGTSLVSIVTPCLNRAPFVAAAVESVLAQDYEAIEHIIVDGVSTDGTLEILGRYPHLRLVSEPDRGMYDAINKGIGMARGDYVCFLNTDDRYAPQAIGAMLTVLADRPDACAVLGGARVFSLAAGVDETVMEYLPFPPDQFLFQATLGVPILNAWLFKRRVLDEVGPFNRRLRYSADRDWLIRLALTKKSYALFDRVVYCYLQHPGSFTFNELNTAESAVVFEDRSIAASYMERTDLAESDRKMFRAWHSRITVDQLLYAISQRDLRKGLAFAATGWKKDRLWPWVFARSIPSSGSRVMNRWLKRQSARR